MGDIGTDLSRLVQTKDVVTLEQIGSRSDLQVNLLWCMAHKYSAVCSTFLVNVVKISSEEAVSKNID